MALKNSKIEMFKDVSTKEELINRILENEWVLQAFFGDSEKVGRIINSIQYLTQEEEKEVMEFIHYVDSHMNYSDYEDDYGKNQKIPAIITGIDYIENYHKRKEELAMDSFMLLSGIPFNDMENGYQEMNEIYPKEILDCIVSRNISFNTQLSIAYLVEKLHNEGKSIDEIIEYIDSRQDNELLTEGDNYINSWIEDAMYSSKK